MISHKSQVTSLKLKLFLICFLLGIWNLGVVTVFAQSISSADLIANAKAHDGKIVEYEGELIGSVLGRGDFVWLNLNDGANAIGVWAPCSMAQDIRRAGSYGVRGDWLGVSGVFHRACVEHGGGLDIHAYGLIVLQEGSVVHETITRKKVLLLSLFLGVLACLLIIHILQTRRSSR
ncbi:MAG: DNA-binding protein [Candidatus Omnitrophica bacterium]|nr:DNA-binding protein [Candidatus Omnitrophota bacterium]